jgi:2-aminoadipate transaminase
MSRLPYVFARRTNRMRASIIREILKIASRPNVISFAGGLPAPTSFPLKEFEKALRETLRVDGTRALQYTITEGHGGLKDYLCGWLGKQGLRVKPTEMVFTHGSQQGLELVGKIFLNPGDKILVEDPTYLGAIQCFNGYEVKYVTVPIDSEGMQTGTLDALLRRHKVRFIYTVPTFHNPAGVTLSLERRKELLKVAARHCVPIIEDDPYGLLRFKGKALPSLYQLARGKGVVYMSTFSKLLSPGIRLGILVAEDQVMKQLLYAKQATDLQNNTLIQYAVYHYCRAGALERHIPNIIRDYKHRAGVMMEAIRRHFPPSVEYLEPEGGMFVWCRLPRGMRASELFKAAIRQNVAFVDGSVFYANGGGENTMRLNFTNCSDAAIREGIERLGRTIQREISRRR